MLSESPFTFDRVVRIAIAVGVIWLLISLIAYLSDVLIPFAVALLLAYLINPLTSWLQRKLPFKHRIISVLLSLTIILAAAVLFLSILIPMVVSEVAQMQRLLSGLVDADQWQARLQNYVPEEIRIYIADLVRFEELIQLLNYENILPGIWGVFSGTISFVIGLAVIIVIVLYLVFILLDFDEISEGWKELIPDPYRQVVLDVVSDFTRAMRVYFRAQALIAFIVGLLFARGFCWACSSGCSTWCPTCRSWALSLRCCSRLPGPWAPARASGSCSSSSWPCSPSYRSFRTPSWFPGSWAGRPGSTRR